MIFISSVPAWTIEPATAGRLETMPSNGARMVVRSSSALSRSTTALAWSSWALPVLTAVVLSSAVSALTALLASSFWARAAADTAPSSVASACVTAACCSASCAFSNEPSSRATTSPLRTLSPSLTSISVSRSPLSSAPTVASCQAETVPVALIEDMAVSDRAFSTETVSVTAGVAGVRAAGSVELRP